MSKVLVAYFSHEGMNYLGGKIVELKKGNTRKVAEKIAARTGGDLFRIEAVEQYPYEYRECVERAKREAAADARPQLAREADVSGYDRIFLGYPDWCGTMPKPVWTFLSGGDFSGKHIYPFCTHEGSGAGRSVKDIEMLCNGAEISEVLAVRGGTADSSDGAIDRWLEDVFTR